MDEKRIEAIIAAKPEQASKRRQSYDNAVARAAKIAPLYDALNKAMAVLKTVLPPEGVNKRERDKSVTYAGLVERSRSALSYAEDLLRNWEDADRYERERVAREADSVQAKARADSQRAAHDDLVTQAIACLVKRGKEVGKDFNVGNAIEIANDVVAIEMVAAAVKASKERGEYVECGCSECGKWDGEDRRCVCGNRRVCWCNSGDFRDMYIYPECY